MKHNKSVRFYLTVVILLVFNYIASAQSVIGTNADTAKTKRPETIYFELGAAGLFFSLNYDTRFSDERNGLGGRIGIGTWKSGSTTFFTTPVQVNYLLGGRNNFLELGAGVTLLALNGTYDGNPLLGYHETNVSTAVLPTTTIGYRHQPYRGGINLGVSFNPMLLESTFIPYFGASLGYTFR